MPEPEPGTGATAARVSRGRDRPLARPHPVIRTDGRAVVLDLSPSGRIQGENVRGAGTARLSQLIDAAMAAAGTRFAFGRYAEPRALYDNDLFLDAGTGERRTIHLGIDVFCAPGTPVRSPLDGVLEIAADNARELDYGPVLVVRHGPGSGNGFFTLYGHLDHGALERLTPGQPVRAGQVVAHVGRPPGNGNWPPHLHFQLILDLVSLGADFPGVAPPSRKDHWLALSPSPAEYFPEVRREDLEYPSP